VPYLMQGMKHALQDVGCCSISDLHDAVYGGRVRFERRSASSRIEGGVHGLHSYQEPHRLRPKRR
jgi:IMP dehydrogenase